MGDHVLLPGDPESPVLLHVPHAGREIPGWVRPHLLLDDHELAAELDALTDHHTDRIAVDAAGRAGVRPWVLVNRVSRFVVDPERFPDEREEMAAVGMAAVYTHDTRGRRIRHDDPAHHAALVAAFHTTWADTVTELVEARLAATGRAVLLDVHSYPADPLPYELHGDGPRPAVCLGTDPVHTPRDLLDAARSAFAGIGTLDVDTPFRGVYVPLRHYGVDPRVHAVMLELRRDGHGDEAGLTAAAGALADLVDRVSAVGPSQ